MLNEYDDPFLTEDFGWENAFVVAGCPHCDGILLGIYETHMLPCPAWNRTHSCVECVDAVIRAMPADPFETDSGRLS
jgi:hypothetical protein